MVEKSGRTTVPTVHVEADNGTLRLRWSYQRNRRSLGLGLPDTKANRLKAREIALQVEVDLETGKFDPSLTKYKPHVTTGKSWGDLTVSELFQEWLGFKRLTWAASTAKNRKELLSPCVKFFGQRRGRDIGESDAIALVKWLKEQGNSERTINDKLTLFKEWWVWLHDKGLVPGNPWESVKKLKVPARKSRPFTDKEISAIFQGFEENESYSELFPFVQFLIGTGARIGEAINLKWQDLSEDCSVVSVLSTKTNTIRTFHLAESIQDVLLKLKPEPQQYDLVFRWNGKKINSKNFRHRVWKPILDKAGVSYRRPYNCRHTFVSHCLERGMNPVTVAEITGHDPKVLFKNYAGGIHRPKTPDLLSCR